MAKCTLVRAPSIFRYLKVSSSHAFRTLADFWAAGWTLTTRNQLLFRQMQALIQVPVTNRPTLSNTGFLLRSELATVYQRYITKLPFPFERLLTFFHSWPIINLQFTRIENEIDAFLALIFNGIVRYAVNWRIFHCEPSFWYMLFPVFNTDT